MRRTVVEDDLDYLFACGSTLQVAPHSDGGPAGVIVPHCREIEDFDPDLTLKGLRILYDMNR